MFTSEYCAFKILTNFDFFYLRCTECFSAILRLSTSFLWRFAIVKTVAWRCCVICLRPAKLFEKRLSHRCSCEFCKIFKNTFYIEHLRRLLLYSGTVWKVFQYGVFPGPYFPVFSPNAGKYRPGKTSYSRIVGFSFRKYFHLREYKNSSYYAVY